MAKNVTKKWKEEVEKKGLTMAVTDKGKEGKNKMIASCGFLEEDVRQCSIEGVTTADSVETLGVDLRTGVKRLGVKEKARRKTCKMRVSLIKKNKPFQKNYMKMGVKKLPRAGYGASKDVERACGGGGPCRKINIEETDGGSSRQIEYHFTVCVHGSIFGLEVKEEMSTLATQCWAEAVWIGKWCLEQKEAWMNQVEFPMWRQAIRLAGAVICETP